MNKFIGILLRHWSKNPVKISMTIFSVALGTAILILSFTTARIMSNDIKRELGVHGSVFMVSNATISNTGVMETVRPSQWDMNALTTLASDSTSIIESVPITSSPFTEIQANGKSWQLRRVLGSGPGYFSILGLKILAGTPMSESDLSSTERKVWISSELAETIFGSVDAAMGQKVQPPMVNIRRAPGGAQAGNEAQATQAIALVYTVSGIYQAPSEVFRKAYGIADAVFAYSAMLPAGNNANFMRNMMAGTFMVKSRSDNISRTEADIRETLAAAYGNDLSIVVWEGGSEGKSEYLEHLRSTINLFSTSVNILGLILLLISSLGIFSVMVVESLGRKREIALERAIGASQNLVLQEFWSWSMALSLMGAVLGLLMALFLAGPVMQTLGPLFGEFGSAIRLDGQLDFGSVALAMGLALGFGGVLGLLPGLSAVRGCIADVLREV